MISKQNIKDMMDLLLAAYGDKAFPTDDPEKMAKVINLWTVMFEQDEPQEVLFAVKDCIATLEFPPRIADIKRRIAKQRMMGQMTEMEAWTVIRKAVDNATSREKAEELFSGFPKILQRTVGSASQLKGWRVVDDEQFETVVASNCMRTYRMLAEQEAGFHALPADLQEAERWRIDGPQTTALPEPEKPKKLAYEKPEWMIRREANGETF